MKRVLCILSVLTAVLSVVPEASAQRTANGEWHASAAFGTSVSSIGGEVLFGTYLMNGQWFAGANFFNRAEIDAPTDEYVNLTHLHFVGGYMYRLFGTLSRNINLYAGGDVFLGMEFFDLFGTMTSPTKEAYKLSGFKDLTFNYGFSLRTEMEFFVSDYFALVPRVRLPFIFNSSFQVLGYEISLALKLNF